LKSDVGVVTGAVFVSFIGIIRAIETVRERITTTYRHSATSPGTLLLLGLPKFPLPNMAESAAREANLASDDGKSFWCEAPRGWKKRVRFC
jgi:hypothetical protein